MSRFAKSVLTAGLLLAGAGVGLLVVFLVGQGLVRASLWATVLSFGLAGLGVVVGVWGLIAARQPSRAADAPDRRDRHPADGRTGSITQISSGGITIAHTGEGDINTSGPAQ